MSSDGETNFLSRLKQGPSFLLLGQSYLKIQASEDSLLTLILRKYPPSAAASATYLDLLSGGASEDRDSAMAWIEERCRTLSAPAWLDLVATFPWNGVYSSAIDSIWPRAFRSEWRELQSILEEKYKPRDPRNRSVLHCTFLFGCSNRTEESQRPPMNKSEWRTRRQVAISLARRLPELLTPRGVLAIEGYRGATDWFAPDDLLPIVEALAPGQVHFFSCNDEVLSDPDLRSLGQKGHIQLHTDSLAQVLNRGTQAGMLRLGPPDSDVEGGYRISLEKTTLGVPRELWQSISRQAIVLDDSAVSPCAPLSEDALYREFREALAKTDARPSWCAYARDLFFSRDFEARLETEVQKRLLASNLADSPLILHGPTGTGKTIAIARLAFNIRRAGKHPVIFIERRTQKTGLAEIEQFCRWLDGSDSPTCLIAWDGMLEPDEYLKAVRYLTSKGRKVLVVGTSYRLHTKAGPEAGYIEASETLSGKESEAFRSYLQKFHPELSSFIGPASSVLRGTFLSSLYRLLPPTRAAIRLGVTKEVGVTEDLILRRASESGSETVLPTALAQALFKAKIVSPAEFLSSTSAVTNEDDFTNLQALTGLIMVPGQFGIRVPVELLMRALEYRHGARLADLLKDVDVFQWYEDSVGNIDIGPRNPLEARLVAQARLGGAASEINFARKLLLEIRENALSSDREVDFAVDLVSAIRGKEESGSPYAPLFRQVADTLTELRVDRGCENPRLMLQEANLLRKSVISSTDDQESTTRMGALDRAEGVLRTALDVIGEDPRRRDLRSFLFVELGSLLATKASSFLQQSDDPSRVVTCFRSMRDALRTARVLSQNSYYPIDVLAWATRNVLAGDALSDLERAEAVADLMYAFETAPRDEFDAEQLVNFEKRRMDFAKSIAQPDMEESAFQSLASMGSAAGYYLRALHISEPYRSAPDDGPWDDVRLIRGLSYLEAHRSEIEQDSRCLDLLLDLWWMTKTNSRLFRGERNSPPLTLGDWQYLLALVERLLLLGHSSRPQVLSYLRGLALFHVRQYDRAFDVFRDLERESDAVWGKRRIIRSYVASSEAGRPLTFHGDVHWLSPDGLRGEVYVTELMRAVKFIGKEFPKQDLRKGTSLGEFHIAFNFLGPIADPKIYYKAR
jgi:hypothetical protein